MQDPRSTPPDPIKPDLKHDSMEYSAATEGDDILDIDKETELEIEEEDITAEELELLEADPDEIQEEALLTAEADSQNDEDNFLLDPEEQDELEVEPPDPANDEEI